MNFPGRLGKVAHLVCMNKKRPDRWGVCIGSQYYPDYVVPDTGGRKGGGGWMLTPEQADDLAAHLIRCSAWARAQNILDSSFDAEEPICLA